MTRCVGLSHGGGPLLLLFPPTPFTPAVPHPSLLPPITGYWSQWLGVVLGVVLERWGGRRSAPGAAPYPVAANQSYHPSDANIENISFLIAPVRGWQALLLPHPFSRPPASLRHTPPTTAGRSLVFYRPSLTWRFVDAGFLQGVP